MEAPEHLIRVILQILQSNGVDLDSKRKSTLQSNHHKRQLCLFTGCISSFSRVYELKRHVKTVHGQKQQCSYWGCPYATARLDKMREHVNKKHKVPDINGAGIQSPRTQSSLNLGPLQDREYMSWVPPMAAVNSSVVVQRKLQASIDLHPDPSWAFGDMFAMHPLSLHPESTGLRHPDSFLIDQGSLDSV